MYNGRNLKCLRPADHKLRAEEEDAIMADSHVDYVMIEDRTDLISFGEDCCEGEANVG